MPDPLALLTDDTDDYTTPLFYEVMEKYNKKFEDSPWVPEYLDDPWPNSITAAIDMIKRDLAVKTPTMALPIVDRPFKATEVIPTVFAPWADPA